MTPQYDFRVTRRRAWDVRRQRAERPGRPCPRPRRGCELRAKPWRTILKAPKVIIGLSFAPAARLGRRPNHPARAVRLLCHVLAVDW